jgi:hypothetical protein
MIPRKIVTALFLAFSIVIAFYDFLQGKPQYIPFIFPFAIALALKGKAGMTVEALGVLAVAVYLMIAQALYIGIMGMIIAAVLFFTLGCRRGVIHAYIYATSFIVGIGAYVNPFGGVHAELAVFLTATIYYVCVFAVHIALDNYIEEVRNAKPLDSKCIEALEKARDTAREAVAIAKQGRGEHGNRRAHRVP